MEIVITGASGFVGKNLTRLFTELGHVVIPLSVRNKGWELPAKADAIIHLAGIEKDTGSGDQSEYFRVNADLSAQVFEKFLTSNIRDFVFFSSIKAAADSLETVLTEETVPAPLTPYGRSKLRAEELLRGYDVPSGKRLIILRPALIHGPEDRGNMRLLYKLVERKLPYPFGAFENQKSYIGVKNLTYLLLEMLTDKEFPGAVYNVADDTPLSTRRIVEIMHEELGRKAQIWDIPVALWKVSLKCASFVGLGIVTEKVKKLTDNFVISTAKLKTALGISQLPQNAEEGFRETVKSFKR